MLIIQHTRGQTTGPVDQSSASSTLLSSSSSPLIFSSHLPSHRHLLFCRYLSGTYVRARADQTREASSDIAHHSATRLCPYLFNARFTLPKQYRAQTDGIQHISLSPVIESIQPPRVPCA